MIIAAMPCNEQQRLEALQGYHIVDTLPEKDYDEITKIASLICGTAISLITFIDEERQFFKAKHGTDLTGTNRNIAFCAHAINTPDKIMIVPDTRLDKRFFDSPVVIGEPHIVFYAGMPLVTEGGHALGTLCVMDNKPGKLSDEQVAVLKCLANQVTKLLELRKTNYLLVESQKKLEAYAAQMEAFAYIASHDLKEPARMVNNFMLLLQNGYADKLDDKAKKYISFAAGGASRMMQLIDELLTYSRMDDLNKPAETIDLKKLVNEVTELLEAVMEEEKATVVHTGLPVITASTTAMKLVFQNLIGNAVKYRLADVKPEVNISASDLGNYWQFAVQDNGIGIEQKNREEIFQLFKRLHSKEEYAGTGMGLATCKKIVESYGGRIWADAGETRGSTFYFTIPKQNKTIV